MWIHEHLSNIRRKSSLTHLLLAGVIAIHSGGNLASAGEYSWQKPHAKVLPNGNLEWAPKPFVFEKGDSVRYIDFEAGNDAKDGKTQKNAWKHHPWDAAAAGAAKDCKGIHTYVLRRATLLLQLTDPTHPSTHPSPSVLIFAQFACL